MLPDQNSIKAYHVYTYTFLDDLSSIRSPYEHFQYKERYRVDDAVRLVGERLTELGWEGDGTIGIIWLPPFVDIGIEDSHGTYVWHVKQMNNGTSFLASDVPLNFERIAEQNRNFAHSGTAPDMEPITLVETVIEWFLDALTDAQNEIAQLDSFLHAHSGPEARRIQTNLLLHYQNTLVCLFNEFMDECYLKVLVEAIDSGNRYKIKLRKARVDIEPTTYVPETDDPYDTVAMVDASSWFTIQGLISDMWKAYKWEPFKAKAEMLFRSLDFVPDKNALFEIRKHVVLRNCIQHHGACLDRDSLKGLGRDKVSIIDRGKVVTINVWKPIVLTVDELQALIDIMIRFAESFGFHVGKRIPTRHFRTKKPTTTSTASNEPASGE